MRRRSTSEEILEIRDVVFKELGKILSRTGKNPTDQAFLLGGAVAQLLLERDDVPKEKKSTDSLTSEFMMGFTSFLRYKGVGVVTDKVFANSELTSSN